MGNHTMNENETVKTPTSEEINGLMKQPAPICPILDSITEHVHSLDYSCNSAEDHNYMINTETHIHSLIDKVRTNCILLREWGEEWKTLALHLMQEPDSKSQFANKFIDILELCKTSPFVLVDREDRHWYVSSLFEFELPFTEHGCKYCVVNMHDFSNSHNHSILKVVLLDTDRTVIDTYVSKDCSVFIIRLMLPSLHAISKILSGADHDD